MREVERIPKFMHSCDEEFQTAVDRYAHVQYVRYVVLSLIVTIKANVLSRSDTIDILHSTLHSLLANVEKGKWDSCPMSVPLGVLQIIRTFFSEYSTLDFDGESNKLDVI